ncbi:hypothetical protein CKA55_10415 [Arcobacter suis]|uniref:Uncharacterized protein n=1 Tax=Arcobacter suis CECT 7833 TaxID=663365 RepID=A0AAD0SPE9_9BACT|nr:hypothetical protein [Arcobacter suis]AXX88669.1 hypothetical protein ASUIS_0154 [Arcobacter suis CECT 7833]RWS45942.1 hypothetical protein CKA55_10415 [Arcobacter suis]
MKKKSFLLIPTSLLILTNSIYAKEIESIVKIKPEIKYDENIKYEKIEDYRSFEENKNKNDFNFGIDVDINKEERTIDLLRIDVQTNF